MSLDKLVSASLHDIANSARVSVAPADLADTALRRHSRRRIARGVAMALTPIVAMATAIGVPTVLARHDGSVAGRVSTGQHAAAPTAHWTPLPLSHAHTGNTSISAHPSEGPPVHLIAADDVALSAYYTESGRSSDGSYAPVTYHWSLYEPWTGTYQKVPWADLDVSPGMGLAAVLEGPVATDRIGIIDMSTGAMLTWIHTSHPVGMVAFSPDGNQLVATTYAAGGDPRIGTKGRNGFIMIDLTNGRQAFHPIPADTSPFGEVGLDASPYNGAVWTADGKYVYLRYQQGDVVKFYRPDGTPANPAHPAELSFEGGLSASISPDGTKANTYLPGSGSAAQTGVKSLTGGHVWHQPVQQLLAWANNDALVAWGCGSNCEGAGEFHSRLVLTSLDGQHVTTLSGPEKGNDASPGQWEVLMTRR